MTTGTSVDPHIISSALDLQNIGRQTILHPANSDWTSVWANSDDEKYNNWAMTSYYVIDNDIDLDDLDVAFIPIGRHNNGTIWTNFSFSGVIDGQNHTISGTDTVTTDGRCGLFPTINGATLKNIKIDVNFTGEEYAGSFFGHSVGGVSTVENCHSYGNVSGNQRTGNLAGDGTNVTFKNCSANGNVTGTTNPCGGFVGQSTSGILIENCCATGDVTAVGAGVYAGGFIGRGRGNIKNCYSTGNVSGNSYAGGFCGFINTSTTDDVIQNCFSVGNVTTTGSSQIIGGFFGVLGSDITMQNCFWDTTTATELSAGDDSGGASSRASVAGISGLPTLDLQTIATFSEYSIIKIEDYNYLNPSANVWYIGSAPTYDAGDTYPKLYWEMSTFIAGVVQLNTAAIEGATIRCLKMDDNTVVTTTTDVNGKYNISVEPGIYHVMVEYDDGATKYHARSHWGVVV